MEVEPKQSSRFFDFTSDGRRMTHTLIVRWAFFMVNLQQNVATNVNP